LPSGEYAQDFTPTEAPINFTLSEWLFSPDGNRIISVDWDRTLKLWDAHSGIEIATYFVNNDVISMINTVSGILSFGVSPRGILNLSIKNIPWGPLIVTPIRLYCFENRDWKDEISVRCDWCCIRFPLETKIINAILSIRNHTTSRRLPDVKLSIQTKNDTILISECPNCHKPLKLNPFIVDNRD